MHLAGWLDRKDNTVVLGETAAVIVVKLEGFALGQAVQGRADQNPSAGKSLRFGLQYKMRIVAF